MLSLLDMLEEALVTEKAKVTEHQGWNEALGLNFGIYVLDTLVFPW